MEVNATFLLVLAGLALTQLVVAAAMITRHKITLSGVVKLLAYELVCVACLVATRRILRRTQSDREVEPISQRSNELR